MNGTSFRAVDGTIGSDGIDVANENYDDVPDYNNDQQISGEELHTHFDLDKDGYGTAIYEVKTPQNIYSIICFSQFLDDNERSDRVIAEKWDTAYTLHIGKVSNKELIRLKKNIPLQEAGRNTANATTLVIVDSKRLMTAAAKKAVAKLI